MNPLEIHTQFKEKTLDQKRTLLNFIFTLAMEKEHPDLTKEQLNEMFEIATGLFIRSQKQFQHQFLKECHPEIKSRIFETLKNPKVLQLAYDPDADPKITSSLKKQDEEMIKYYNEIREKREKSEQEQVVWKKKHETENIQLAGQAHYKKVEAQWNKELHQERPAHAQSPAAVLIIDFISNNQFDKAAKKFVTADIQTQKHVIDDIDKNKEKNKLDYFITAIEKEIADIILAEKQKGKTINNEIDWPDQCHRANVSILYLKETLATA